jgi:hypothetical protein
MGKRIVPVAWFGRTILLYAVLVIAAGVSASGYIG